MMPCAQLSLQPACCEHLNRNTRGSFHALCLLSSCQLATPVMAFQQAAYLPNEAALLLLWQGGNTSNQGGLLHSACWCPGVALCLRHHDIRRKLGAPAGGKHSPASILE